MRLELLETAKSLPTTFSKILELLNGESVSQAMKYYGDFARDAHTEKEVGLIITEILDVASLLRPSLVEFTLATFVTWMWKHVAAGYGFGMNTMTSGSIIS